MRRFGHLGVVWMVLMAMVLVACGPQQQRGEEAARQLIAVWGDTVAMRASADHMRAMCADEHLPWQRLAFKRAFAQTMLATDRDSLMQAAYMLSFSPQEFAQFKAYPMTNSLIKHYFPTDSAITYLALLHWLSRNLGCEQHMQAMDSTLAAIASSYSITEQMHIQAQSTHPEQLAIKLAHDIKQSHADSADINTRIEALKRIYDEEQLRQFQQAFNAARH